MHKKVVVEFTEEELQDFIEDENSCVKLRKSKYHLALLPYHLADISSSIKDILNLGIAKYDKKLDGILLSYKNVRILNRRGSIVTDSFYIHIDIAADFYVFKPDVGRTLTGVVNKKSHGHVGCLVHRLFNVSVPNKNDDSNWLGSSVDIGEEVLLKINHINLEASLPYIRASLVSKTKKRKKKKKHTENNLNISQDETKNTENETQSDDINGTFKEMKENNTSKKKSKNKKSLEATDISNLEHVTETQDESNNSFSKKKKHKKSSKHLHDFDDQNEQSEKFTEKTNAMNTKLNKSKASPEKSFESIAETSTTNHSHSEKSQRRKKHKHKTNKVYEKDYTDLCSSETNKRSEDKLEMTADLEDRCVNLEYASYGQKMSFNDLDMNLSDTEIEKTLNESKKRKSLDNARNANVDKSSNSPSKTKKRKRLSSVEGEESSKKHKRRKSQNISQTSSGIEEF